MGIWFGDPTPEEINHASADSLVGHLGIELVEFRESSLVGRMPVDPRTHQPFGVLHGGASVAFAETLASWAAVCTLDPEKAHAVGMEINANHIRPISDGWVTGEATAVNLGRRTQVWDIRITNPDGKLVCISRCTMAVVEAAAPRQG